MSSYTDNGFKDRKEYLESLAQEYDIDLEVVIAASDLLGEVEDFDGLISLLDSV